MDNVDQVQAFAALEAIQAGRWDRVLHRFAGAVKMRMTTEDYRRSLVIGGGPAPAGDPPAVNVGKSEPAALGPHGFLRSPTGRGGCFRTVNRDGREPRCGKHAEDPIHQVATVQPAAPPRQWVTSNGADVTLHPFTPGAVTPFARCAHRGSNTRICDGPREAAYHAADPDTGSGT